MQQVEQSGEPMAPSAQAGVTTCVMGNVKHFLLKILTQCCAPLTSHAGTQPFNNVSTPIVQSAGIPIVRIYKRLAPMWQSHIGCPSEHPGYPDCTHLHPDGAKVAVHALGTAVEHAETACSGRLQGPAATPWHHAESVPGLRLGRTYADWV